MHNSKEKEEIEQLFAQQTHKATPGLDYQPPSSSRLALVASSFACAFVALMASASDRSSVLSMASFIFLRAVAALSSPPPRFSKLCRHALQDADRLDSYSPTQLNAYRLRCVRANFALVSILFRFFFFSPTNQRVLLSLPPLPHSFELLVF